MQELFHLHSLLSKKAFLGVFTRVEIAVISDKLIFSFVRSTHFVLVCFVLFLFFPASPSRKVGFRIISCDLLYIFMRAYMCMRIVVVSPSGFRCSVTFLSLCLLGTILNNWFLTFSMLTPLIILANSADGIIQYLIRYSGAGKCYFRF